MNRCLVLWDMGYEVQNIKCCISSGNLILLTGLFLEFWKAVWLTSIQAENRSHESAFTFHVTCYWDSIKCHSIPSPFHFSLDWCFLYKTEYKGPQGLILTFLWCSRLLRLKSYHSSDLKMIRTPSTPLKVRKRSLAPPQKQLSIFLSQCLPKYISSSAKYQVRTWCWSNICNMYVQIKNISIPVPYHLQANTAAYRWKWLMKQWVQFMQ